MTNITFPSTTPILSPLSPNIQMQILQTDLYTFPLRISWENWINDHGILSLVIILLILITLSIENVWILLGKNWCWSLLVLKGFYNQETGLWELVKLSPWRKSFDPLSSAFRLIFMECCERFKPRSHFISKLSMNVWVNVVLNRTVVVDSHWRFDNLCSSHLQSQSLTQSFNGMYGD